MKYFLVCCKRSMYCMAMGACMVSFPSIASPYNTIMVTYFRYCGSQTFPWMRYDFITSRCYVSASKWQRCCFLLVATISLSCSIKISFKYASLSLSLWSLALCVSLVDSFSLALSLLFKTVTTPFNCANANISQTMMMNYSEFWWDVLCFTWYWVWKYMQRYSNTMLSFMSEFKNYQPLASWWIPSCTF